MTYRISSGKILSRSSLFSEIEFPEFNQFVLVPRETKALSRESRTTLLATSTSSIKSSMLISQPPL